METQRSFNYALFDHDETALRGCVHIDPPEKVGADAEISRWVVDDLVGSEPEAALDAFVPDWIATSWPLVSSRLVGRDLSWDDWFALLDHPELDPPG